MVAVAGRLLTGFAGVHLFDFLLDGYRMISIVEAGDRINVHDFARTVRFGGTRASMVRIDAPGRFSCSADGSRVLWTEANAGDALVANVCGRRVALFDTLVDRWYQYHLGFLEVTETPLGRLQRGAPSGEGDGQHHSENSGRKFAARSAS